MRTGILQLWQREIPLHRQRGFRTRLQNAAGYSTGIVPNDPPYPEPNAAVNKVLFCQPKTVTEGISLAEARLEPVTSVEGSLFRAVQGALTKVRRHSGGQRWMATLTERKFDLRSPELRTNILQLYSDLSMRVETMKDEVRWQLALHELDRLKAVGQTVATSPAR
jgi:hypothetical protein